MNAALVVILMLGRKAYKGTLKTNIRMMTPMMRKTSPHRSPVTTVIKNIWMNLEMICVSGMHNCAFNRFDVC